MSTDYPRKIFLSHKTFYKPRVLEFKKTLEKVGYEVWLDEYDMPAGVDPNRGLQQGMKDSCAVVFFITPSFEDRGYLASEINYALQEKVERGDEFAIITLQMRGENGETAPIPDPLRAYVWKSPETELEAFREIDRAVSIVLENMKRRDEIAETVTESEGPSPALELSDEAKTILREAASRDGMIINEPDLDNHHIFARQKQLIPDQRPRTLARWKGGLKQLRRCEYIERIGATSEVFDPTEEYITAKGEVFKVTSDGYEAADEIGA